MNRILFDVTCLLPKQLSGVGVYSYQLFRGLKNIGAEISPVYKASRLLKENHTEVNLGQKAAPFLDLNPFGDKGSILHGPDFKLLSGKSKFHKVLTVHDLAVYREGLLDRAFCREGQEKLKSELDKQPDAIIVPTEFIWGEFLTRFPKFKDRTHVVYHGCDHLLDTDSVAGGKKLKIIDKPFLLYVGHLEKRKNVEGLVRAFEVFGEKNGDVDLVIVGKDGFGAKSLHGLMDRSPMASRIQRLGYVGPAQLKSLYQRTLAFIYPSFYEGFGMPIIEAMQLGAPVITSNGSSTAEVAGPGAHLVDPKSIEELAFAYSKVAGDSAYRKKLKTAGKERAGEFSWLKTARETLKIYKTF